jgi:hypothetical protein
MFELTLDRKVVSVKSRAKKKKKKKKKTTEISDVRNHRTFATKHVQEETGKPGR